MLGDSELVIQPSTLGLVLGMVALVWVSTAAILAFVARRHHVTLGIHCPLLRRDVVVDGAEWGSNLVDVRRCSGLHPSTDFELCQRGCLDLDELIPVKAE